MKETSLNPSSETGTFCNNGVYLTACKKLQYQKQVKE